MHEGFNVITLAYDHLPGATNVYDVNSKGLTELALRFNQGINTDGDAQVSVIASQSNYDLDM
jgi:hypothetical protein